VSVDESDEIIPSNDDDINEILDIPNVDMSNQLNNWEGLEINFDHNELEFEDNVQDYSYDV
jgi:hypothetical protein